jgi:hypothetical protein
VSTGPTEVGTGPPEQSTGGGSWERWYSLATTFVAPATFLTALLFYFGYVSSRAEYRYFGLDVDTIGLSTQDYVMRSPQALLVPALLFTVLGAGGLLLSRRLDRIPLTPGAVRGAHVAAGLLVGAGMVLVAGYRWFGAWPFYPMVTPVLLAAGLTVLAWLWHRTGVRRGVVAFTVLAVATCLFWATATLAQWTGLGVAQRTARDLDQLPAVVVDTKERLYLGDGVVEEVRLPREEGQEFAYRYTRFRLLIQAGDRMFLVPDTWVPRGSTVMLPMDDVRVRFRFVDEPP